MLGYDRNRAHGPWLIRTFVRWLHRSAIYVEWNDVTDVDWSQRNLFINEAKHVRLLEQNRDGDSE